jgi:hypothetical protein
MCVCVCACICVYVCMRIRACVRECVSRSDRVACSSSSAVSLHRIVCYLSARPTVGRLTHCPRLERNPLHLYPRCVAPSPSFRPSTKITNTRILNHLLAHTCAYTYPCIHTHTHTHTHTHAAHAGSSRVGLGAVATGAAAAQPIVQVAGHMARHSPPPQRAQVRDLLQSIHDPSHLSVFVYWVGSIRACCREFLRAGLCWSC